ncbi:MAG: hypothetical protein A3C36_04840 [Omnitrophica WOR_2 bacterium RIFCSPHIGHO2_02_FULL_52_10]|nr:MAG: hypothetical protein A3C36_04840 [Omnitrophica WOR_2 bacterium RIFCSPHIGHO2_02_FULL_52_10]
MTLISEIQRLKMDGFKATKRALVLFIHKEKIDMTEGEKTIIEIRKGLVDQFVLATGQFVGEIDRILLTFDLKDEDIVDSSPMMFAYFTALMAVIETTEDFPDIAFFYIGEYKRAISKTWAASPKMIPECDKDLEVAAKLFNKVIGDSVSIRNFKGRESLSEISLKLSEEFVSILFHDPIKDEKLKNDLTSAVSNFHTERLA